MLLINSLKASYDKYENAGIDKLADNLKYIELEVARLKRVE